MPDLHTSEPTRRVVVPLHGEDVTVHYAPGRVTVGRIRNIMAIDDNDAATGIDATIGLLAQVVTAWDITVNGGEPFPVSSEAMQDLPISFLAALFGAIADDFGGGNRSSRRRRGR